MATIKDTIRCCISCILPCGALDVIRIVHVNGRVEEISGGTVMAEEIMKLNPKHILKKPSTKSDFDDLRPRITVVPPHAELKRGRIYFLIPLPPEPERTPTRMSSGKRRKNTVQFTENRDPSARTGGGISEKISGQRNRRRGRVGVWRPHLESISETTPPPEAGLFHYVQ